MVTEETFRELALSFPGVAELPHFEKISFRAANKKIFATLDVENKRVCLMLSAVDQSVFCAFDKAVIYPVPDKWGKSGATFVELKTVRKSTLKDAMTQAHAKVMAKQVKKKN
ncbi:MAG: MmcQ/YjbR family DNA-binding protein [Bacteroidia bacterium]